MLDVLKGFSFILEVLYGGLEKLKKIFNCHFYPSVFAHFVSGFGFNESGSSTPLLGCLYEAAYYWRPWFVQEMPVTSAITHPANNTAVQPGKILEVSGKNYIS